MNYFYHYILSSGRYYSILIGILSSVLVTILLSTEMNTSYITSTALCMLSISLLSVFLPVCDKYTELYLIGTSNGDVNARTHAISHLDDTYKHSKARVQAFLIIEIILLSATIYHSYQGREKNMLKEDENNKKKEQAITGTIRSLHDKIDHLESTLFKISRKIDSLQTSGSDKNSNPSYKSTTSSHRTGKK